MNREGGEPHPGFTLVTRVLRKGDGQGRVNYEIAKEAVRRGVRVVAVSTEIAPDLLDDPLVTWREVRTGRIPSNLLRELAFAARSKRLLRKRPPGPILSNGCATPVAADVNACHFVHSSWLASPVHPSRLVKGAAGAYQRLYSEVNARLERSAYSKAGLVVSVSEQVRRELAAAGIPAERIVTVTNGVDSDEFRPGPPDRPRFGLPEGVPLALFAGDIRSPRKNLDAVLRALPDAPGVHLAVAGWLESSPYPAMAAGLGISDRVHFLGNVREMPLLMRSCDLFAFPSRYEACSLVMLEVLASGLPILTSRTTGGAELVPEDGGFLMNDPDDVGAVVDALRRTGSRAELDARSARSREAALPLRWDSMAAKYLKLLGVA